jgi:hypothetical protein
MATDPEQEGAATTSTRSTDRDAEGTGTQPPQQRASTGSDGLLAVVRNLSQYHREHEKYYAETPLTDAISLQRTARTLMALAERWSTAEPAAARPQSVCRCA